MRTLPDRRRGLPIPSWSCPKGGLPWALIGALAVLLVGCTTFKRFAYEGFGRDEWQKPEEVIRTLNLRSGDHVADLGSGGGYFTFRLARAVGPTGKVYAVDIDPGLNEYVADRARQEGVANIEVIQAKANDPLLPSAGVDMLFMCNTYHHLQHRVSYFQNVRKYLRRGGRVAIVEFNDKYWLTRMFGHWTETNVIRREMEAAGYRLAAEYDFLPRQSFLVFSIDGP